MKHSSLTPRLAVLVGTMFALLALAGCSSSTPSPSRFNLAIRRLQTDSTNVMIYVQYKRLEAGGERVLQRLGSNHDSYLGMADTSPSTSRQSGKYSFRVWCPELVTTRPWYGTGRPRGKTHAELLVDGQVKAVLDLDAARPHFENDTCSYTTTLDIK